MELYSLLEMSRRLDTPESTVRRWKDRFSDYLPTTSDGRYKPEALEALRLVQAMRAEDASWDDVESALRAGFARTIEVSPPSDSASPSPAVTALGEMVSASVRDALAEHAATMEDALEEQNRLLREHLEAERRGRERIEERLRVQEELARDALARLPKPEAQRETIRGRLRRALGR